MSSSSSAGIRHSQEVHRTGPIRGCIDFDRGVDRSSAAEKTFSVMKRIERAPGVRILQICCQFADGIFRKLQAHSSTPKS